MTDEESTVEETESGIRIPTAEAVHEVSEHHVVPGAPTMEVVTRSAAEGTPDRTWVVGGADKAVRDRLSDPSEVDTWVVTDPADVDDTSLAAEADRLILAANLDHNDVEVSEFLDDPNVDEADVEWVEQGDTFEEGAFEVTSPDTFDRGKRDYFRLPGENDRVGVSVDFVAGDARVSYYARNARDVVDSYHRDAGVAPDHGVNDPRRDQFAGEDAEDLQWDVDGSLVRDDIESKEVLQAEGDDVDPEASSEIIDAEEHEPEAGDDGPDDENQSRNDI